MSLSINIDDLLQKRWIESSRVEFREDWAPDAVYRTICAFANDRDNLGGGYILVGVAEENGCAKRPVCGMAPAKLDAIQKAMAEFNHLMSPYYCPKTSVEEVDGASILVIWVPAGDYRPYRVLTQVAGKPQERKIYVRAGARSVAAKDAAAQEFVETGCRRPFDERGNEQISERDIPMGMVRDHLAKVNSRLFDGVMQRPLMETLEQMDLLEGPPEHRRIRNVAAMMFCETPEKFFPYTQVDIVRFAVSRVETLDEITENLTIRGPVPQMIRQTMAVLRQLIEKKIIKLPVEERINGERVLEITNYPIKALEEVVVNALYHRDYSIREPVEITIERDSIAVLSFPGPDRSIPAESWRQGRKFVSRRCRNRRLGDFLRALRLTGERASGIETIQRVLRDNGSPEAVFETNEERSYCLVTIPIHPQFLAIDEKNLNVPELLRKKLAQIEGQFEDNPYYDKLRLASMKTKTALADDIQKLVRNCQQPRSVEEIRSVMAGCSETYVRRQLIGPLATLGILKRTMPDRPKSKLQKYVSAVQLIVAE